MPFVDYKPEKPVCRHPEHDPPSMIVLPAGMHTWECPNPNCKRRISFRVEKPFLRVRDREVAEALRWRPGVRV